MIKHFFLYRCKTSTQLLHTLAFALWAAFGMAVAPTSLAAESTAGQALAPVVHDLDTRRGVAAVYQRVQAIAEQNCVAHTQGDRALTAAQQACRDEVLSRLLGKLADPYLSYLHANPDELLVAQR